VGDLGHIQSQSAQDHLGIRQEAAAAQLGARVARLFQDQRARHEVRRNLSQVERGGESGRACARNDDIVL
jgi:hypothetical protein